LEVTEESDDSQRAQAYANTTPRLSDLRGIAACAEQAALGQYLLQHVLREGFTSAYVSGVEGDETRIGDHSFIVLRDTCDTTFIYDISRPRREQNLPRLLRTDIPFTREIFEGKKNLLIGGTEVLQGGRIYFGVGNPYREARPLLASR
jgi:hypothetical protein